MLKCYSQESNSASYRYISHIYFSFMIFLWFPSWIWPSWWNHTQKREEDKEIPGPQKWQLKSFLHRYENIIFSDSRFYTRLTTRPIRLTKIGRVISDSQGVISDTSHGSLRSYVIALGGQIGIGLGSGCNTLLVVVIGCCWLLLLVVFFLCCDSIVDVVIYFVAGVVVLMLLSLLLWASVWFCVIW